MLKFRLYIISDEYVSYLEKFDKRVSSNKEESRKFERKYLGVVLSVNELDYFVPLASPKDSDYDNDNQIRKSIIPIIRMIHIEKDGSLTLVGTLKFNNMIPVIHSVVQEYDGKNECDLQYRELVNKQWNYISKHINQILRNAKTIYNEKINNTENKGYLRSTVDFLLLETKAKEYKSN